MACDPSFTFWIDGHSLTIIEADGEYTEPHVVDSFVIHAGQRYSVILAANQPIGSYWIRANPVPGAAGFDGGRNSAILRYVGALEEEPMSTSMPVNPLKEIDLHALRNARAPGDPIPGGADYVLHLDMTLKSSQWVINGVPYSPPTTPVLLQILSGVRDARELLPKGSVYSLPPNKVIEISMHDAKFGPHPFHLHGVSVLLARLLKVIKSQMKHSFYVVRSGDSDVYNYLNPVQRDTVNTGTGNTTIRFITDNAGPWFLHCHIDWHLEFGLAVILVEDIGHIASSYPVPGE
ncbi:hypothetical protein H0H92_008148 [Tricholoma furcatifolium]|nr:hypothetical protein H0H92_008148 [Tricholoma furcatifolium]